MPVTLELLHQQLEANQKLLLAALQATEQADDAHDAQVRAEQENSALKEGELELRAMAEFRERLIGIIGHDLRTPLNTILMAAGLLTSRSTLNEAEAGLVARIVSSGQRMSRMIGQLADFTRARLGGGFALQVAPTDMEDICHDVAEELRLTSLVVLHQRSRGNVCGVWDPDRLAQALSNIASNAIDHAEPASIVIIDAVADGAWVQVEITNRGRCIPPEVLPLIFTAFRRAESEHGQRAGHLGLGLFVANEVTKAHGGSLAVRSREGSTTFTLRLPRAPSH